jgi:hypothetical protein
MGWQVAPEGAGDDDRECERQGNRKRRGVPAPYSGTECDDVRCGFDFRHMSGIACRISVCVEALSSQERRRRSRAWQV